MWVFIQTFLFQDESFSTTEDVLNDGFCHAIFSGKAAVGESLRFPVAHNHGCNDIGIGLPGIELLRSFWKRLERIPINAH